MILLCKSCFTSTQINHEKPSFTSPNYIKFCPCCGSRNTAVRQDDDEEAWYEIAQQLPAPVQTTKQLYELWRSMGDEANPRFLEWIKEMRKK